MAIEDHGLAIEDDGFFSYPHHLHPLDTQDALW
jgi:hypothetical protein